MVKKDINSYGVRVRDVKSIEHPTLLTGIKILDDAFSRQSGISVRSCFLLSGNSGSGKSSLMMLLMSLLPNIVSAVYQKEMDSESICEQVDGYKSMHDNSYICDEDTCPNFNNFMEYINSIHARLVIIDSIHAVAQNDFPDMTEDEAINYISKTMRDYAKNNDAIVFIIAHNTKQTSVFAGRNTLLQYLTGWVDMVFDIKTGERSLNFRKNRKGPLKALNYVIDDSGFDFYTPEDYALLSDDRSFPDSLTTMIQSYASTIKNKEALKIYNQRIKIIAKIKDSSVLCLELVNLMNELHEKFGI